MSATTMPQDDRALRGNVRETLHKVLAQVGADPARAGEILDGTPEALMAFDPGRRILHANALGAAVFGYQPAELVGQPTDMLIPERLRQPDAPPMRGQEDLMQVELPGLMRDGRERTIEWCFGSVRAGASWIFVMTVRDRLELERALDALRASEQRFQLLINGVRDCAIFMLNAEGRVSSWNTGAARIKGWDASEILGQPYEIFFTPEDRAAGMPRVLMGDALRNGSREVTGWRVRKDGSRFWAQGSLTALRGEDGELRGFAKVTRDLTERRNAEEIERRLIAERAAREAAQQAEQRVRDGEERLRRLQRMTAALSQAATPEDVSTVVLREAADALGAAGGTVYLATDDEAGLEALGHRGPGLPDDMRRLTLDVPVPHTDAARRRTPLFFEDLDACLRAYPALRASIPAGSFEASVVVPLVARGALVGVLGLRFMQPRAFDAAERALVATVAELCSQALDRARLFRAERDARAAAESANRSKDEFLAMLGHELRNPLAPIRTAVQLMKLRTDDGTAREREIIERQVAHLGRLVDDLLDVSRVARGLITLSRQPMEAAEIVDKAVEMVTPLLTQRSQHLTVTVPRAGLRISADPVRLAQVVANLLDNAAKYTPAGGRVWLNAALEDGSVVIRVRDDGGGISAELLPRVFDIFVQGSQSVARPEGGLGLGLALVKSFVNLHGGTVSASSAGPGQGSEFVVELPALGAGPAVAAATATVTTAAPAVLGKRILVVDDNEDAGEMLAEVLRALGHQVQVAPDGPTALRQLRAFPAEVAILDLGLPVMDGFELARQVRARQEGARTRLIAVTGYGRDRDIAQTRSAGFDVHLVKPVDIAALVTALEPGAP